MEDILPKVLKESSQVRPSMNEEELRNKIIPEQVEKGKAFFNDGIKKGVIVCSVWLLGKNGARDKLVGSQKRKIGKTDFVVKGKRYYINYQELKEGKKFYYYDCDVENAIGTLSFHDLSDRKIYPNQADHMLVDGVVRVMMAKGGIPALWLLIAMIMTAVAIAGLMYFLSQYQSQGKEIENLKTLSANRLDQLKQLEEQGIVIPPARVQGK